MMATETFVRLITINPKADKLLRERVDILRNALGVDVTIQELARDRRAVDYTMTVVGDINALGLVVSYLARAGLAEGREIG